MKVTFFGTKPYEEVDQLQAEAAMRADRAVFIGEHPPVYVRGANATAPAPGNGIPAIDARRGGDITYHGPGQLIARLVAPWTGSSFTAAVEQAVIDTLAPEGVEGHTVARYPGVWVGDRKIASLGFRVEAGWVCAGGVAVNVDLDLAPFDAIVPCGIAGVQMTSLAAETGRSDFPGVRGRFADRLIDTLATGR